MQMPEDKSGHFSNFSLTAARLFTCHGGCPKGRRLKKKNKQSAIGQTRGWV
jgi:hypothetical protein